MWLISSSRCGAAVSTLGPLEEKKERCDVYLCSCRMVLESVKCTHYNWIKSTLCLANTIDFPFKCIFSAECLQFEKEISTSSDVYRNKDETMGALQYRASTHKSKQVQRTVQMKSKFCINCDDWQVLWKSRAQAVFLCSQMNLWLGNCCVIALKSIFLKTQIE